MAFKLSKRSLDKLEGVDSDLVAVVKRAIEITEIDFAVTEGLRTKERQAQLVQEKKSWTMNSNHISGRAVDLAAFRGNKVSWEGADYAVINKAMQQAATELSVALTWGGEWKVFDAVHWELKGAKK